MRLEPGWHEASVALPDGGRASLDFTLAADEVIESKGRRWWCLTVGRRNGELMWIQLPPAQCKALADKGPD